MVTLAGTSGNGLVPACNKAEAVTRLSALTGSAPERLGPGSKERKSLLVNLATSEIALGRWDDADRHLEASLRLEEQIYGPIMGAPSYIVRSQLCRGRGLYAEADAWEESARAIRSRFPDVPKRDRAGG